MQNNDLYSVLGLESTDSLTDIKKQFKKMALIYHPDKNPSPDANEKFNQIRIAYDILSDVNKKEKYDKMTNNKKKDFIDMIFQFLKQITNPETIHNIVSRPDIMLDIKNGEIKKIANKMIKKILDNINIDMDFDIDKLHEIFIHSPNNQNDDIQIQTKKEHNQILNTDYTSQSNKLETSDCNTLNIFGNIKTNLDDIYHNRIKEVIIKQKIYKSNKIINYETKTYYIPLYDYKVIIEKAGDKIVDFANDSINDIGNVILKIYCKKDKVMTRNGYNIIYNEQITLFELFNGFNKNITYFDSTINICSENPFDEYVFDGKKISVCIKNKGLPCDENDNRGDLIVNFYLEKKNDFMEKIKTHFS